MDQVESVEPNPAAAKKMTDFIDLEWLTYIDLKPKCVLTRKNQLLAQILTRDSNTGWYLRFDWPVTLVLTFPVRVWFVILTDRVGIVFVTAESGCTVLGAGGWIKQCKCRDKAAGRRYWLSRSSPRETVNVVKIQENTGVNEWGRQLAGLIGD